MLTAAELAAYLGLTPNRVRRIINQHHIPVAAKRGRWRYYDARTVLAITGRHDRRVRVDSPAKIDAH